MARGANKNSALFPSAGYREAQHSLPSTRDYSLNGCCSKRSRGVASASAATAVIGVMVTAAVGVMVHPSRS